MFAADAPLSEIYLLLFLNEDVSKRIVLNPDNPIDAILDKEKSINFDKVNKNIMV